MELLQSCTKSSIFAFNIISRHWKVAGCWYFLPRQTRIFTFTQSMSWLLMTWRCKEPGHQQPWYWLSSPPKYTCFSTRKFKNKSNCRFHTLIIVMRCGFQIPYELLNLRALKIPLLYFALYCKGVSHWLGAYKKWSLYNWTRYIF